MAMKLLALVLGVLSSSEAAPAPQVEKKSCTTVLQRKAWHTLTPDEKAAYIDAEKCLMALPAKLDFTGPRTRFDEFQKLHVLTTESVHFVGAFLPYHRYLMHAHEQILRTECGYTGSQPYWDEPLDAGNFSSSLLLDPDTGFGGNGVGEDGCIVDGPFKDYVNAIGPFKEITDHCIERSLDECASAMAAQEYIDECMEMDDYSTMWPCLESRPHNAGHAGIGAQMLNLYSSPGDPLFYLHHTYLDKVWWDWQVRNLSARLTDITGTNVGWPGGFPWLPVNGSLPEAPGNGSGPGPGNGTCAGFPVEPFHTAAVSSAGRLMSDGDPSDVTTLGHVLTLYGMLPNVTIADVMDVQGGLLCYEYA